MIYQQLTDLIGSTPLLEVSGLEGQTARIALKLELFNPGGSVKDRIALAMIEDAEQRITPTTIRLSIGVEHIDDILADLEQAFN